jgi:ubiquinone/menaquinone biosynthesis C-methylase UbiE
MKQNKIWEYYQTKSPESFLGNEARLFFLAKKAKKISPRGKILNIGVGTGIFEEFALKLGLDVYSLDPIEDTIESIRKRFNLGEKARVGYSQDIPFPDNYFDVVVMSEVLEHLSDSDIYKTLKEVYRILTPNGHFIGTVPAREKLANGIVVCPNCGERFHRWGHLQSFEPSRIYDLFSGKFEIKELQERYFITWRTVNWKGKIVGFLKTLLNILGVHGRKEVIYFNARKY